MTYDDIIVDPISKNDASGIYLLMIENFKRFHRFFPKTLEANLTLETAREFAIKKEMEFNKKEEFLFVIKKIKNIIGLIYIKELDWKKNQGEYAYCIDKNQEGKGITTKVVKELTEYAFTQLDLSVLQIIVHKDNIASIKVAKNSGFIWQKTLLKEYTPPDGIPLDMELYELYNER